MKADHKEVMRLLNIASGQLNGVKKMVEEDAYCIDISNQILAAIANIKKANNAIIVAHLEHCVRNASDDEEIEAKIKEISKLMTRLD